MSRNTPFQVGDLIKSTNPTSFGVVMSVTYKKTPPNHYIRTLYHWEYKIFWMRSNFFTEITDDENFTKAAGWEFELVSRAEI